MTILKRAEWSKSYCHAPRDNINPTIITKANKFISSFARDPCPPQMNLLIGWEYGRNWLKERDTFAKKRALMNRPKIIHNDYKKWIDKRKVHKPVVDGIKSKSS